MKKSYLYNFFPVKEDEERYAAAAASSAFGPRLQRMLVEIRDVHPPPEIDPRDPWPIKKALNHYEIASGKVIVSFNDTFEHILRYWNFGMATNITVWGRKVAVLVWDVTNEKKPRSYDGSNVYFQMTPSGNCLLTCGEMMNARNMKAEDKIGLCWENKNSCFHIKLFR
ncbi:Putative B3 domain-containing protein [Striga hermonthica]|uniref:B3 domain-containing protein n=1 Tax=Striga hermonthica TaxID=68872 RepID=A0A9N7MFS7_STRHE|nr:Putative B3 domain-containing protein [Striga hermonthica]